MSGLVSWWSEAMGWDGTITLLCLLSAGTAIFITTWCAGVAEGRRQERQRNFWRHQRILQ